MGRNISNREVEAGHTLVDIKPDTEPYLSLEQPCLILGLVINNYSSKHSSTVCCKYDHFIYYSRLSRRFPDLKS